MRTLIVAEQTPAAPSLPGLSRLWRTNWPLTVVGLGSLALLAFTAVMIVVDPRLITGAPAWVKPAKFALSTIAYALTLTWMLGYVQGRPRLVNVVGTVTAAGFIVELALIVVQVVRGVRSHFNLSTPLDGALFSIMGVTIVVVWLMNLLAALLVLRQKFTDPALAWSLRLGLLITLYGAGVAFCMTSPTPDQLAALQAGAAPAFIGAHSVGVADGGAGLPFLGWSTTGGDLRIPHFVGLHALQIVPGLGWLISRLFTAFSARRRAALVWTGALGYLGLALTLTWQALRGQSVIAPDAWTLGALAVLGLSVAGLSAALILSGRRAASSI
ncbi:MAG: hypothetical protein KA764_14010 [Anaerolineales bacterium]|nr:hypothetical protein [Anaerolineales bacterium]